MEKIKIKNQSCRTNITDTARGRMAKKSRKQSERRLAKVKRRSRKGQLVMLDGGAACPKGHGPMQRCAHGDDWKPKARQPYYFSYWDRCLRCNHLQHYEAAKVWLRSHEEIARDQLGDAPENFDMDRWEMI